MMRTAALALVIALVGMVSPSAVQQLATEQDRRDALQYYRAGQELMSGEQPASGPVLQAEDVGNAHALQNAGADDAARTSRTVDDDRRVLVEIPGDVGDAESELAARHAAAGGDAEAPELLGGAAVEDDELLALLHPLGEILRLDLGNVVHRLDLLTEILARHVASPLRGEPVGHPAIDAAVEHRHVTVPHALRRGRGKPGAASVVVT